MGIVAKVGEALQTLLGDFVEEAAAKSGVIKRKRKFTPSSLAATFILGFLQKPNASDENLAQMAAQRGAEVTTQAVEQRYSPALVRFLEDLFRKATRLVVESDRSLAPLVDRFSKVVVLDSSTLSLPDSMQEQFPGCGGSYGAGKAALKLQTEIDLRHGGIHHIEIESGRSTDGATSRQDARHGDGSLRITDLGYFNLRVFAEMKAAHEHFLSRLQFGTRVMLPTGEPVDLIQWLNDENGPIVDRTILLGKEQRLACRLIAWRLPPEQANRRRQKLREELRRKLGKDPSAERLAWCDWTILVTSVPEEMLTPQEAAVLYRARWQVELTLQALEVTKSRGRLAWCDGNSANREGLGAIARVPGATLVGLGYCLGRPDEESQQSLRSDPSIFQLHRRQRRSTRRAVRDLEHPLPNNPQNLSPKQTKETRHVRTS